MKAVKYQPPHFLLSFGAWQGILSDILVATAAEHRSPLAVVPCCPSRKARLLKVSSPYAVNLYQDIVRTSSTMPDLAERLDEARMAALENADMRVEEVILPAIFTKKNRLILGIPTTLSWNKEASACKDSEMPAMPTKAGRNMPPIDNSMGILPKPGFLKGFYVPCEDTAEQRALVSKLAGRVAANSRKAVMHNRGHNKNPQLDISFWLPHEHVGLSQGTLCRFVETAHSVNCSVSNIGDAFVHPSGRVSKTFRVQYNTSDGQAMIPYEKAKVMHTQLYDMIPKAFPGVECR